MGFEPEAVRLDGSSNRDAGIVRIVVGSDATSNDKEVATTGNVCFGLRVVGIGVDRFDASVGMLSEYPSASPYCCRC